MDIKVCLFFTLKYSVMNFYIYIYKIFWSSYCGTVERNPTSIHEDMGFIPGLTRWVGDLVLHELWCRLQMRLGSHVAVAVAWAGSCSSDSTPSLGTSICLRCGPKTQKIK